MKIKEKACLNCKVVYEGDKCPICNENIFTESFKGKVYINDPENSEVAKNMKINNKGMFAIKTK